MGRPAITAAELSYQLSGLPDRRTYLSAAAACLHAAVGGDAVGWNDFDLSSGAVELWADPPDAPVSVERLAAVVNDHPLVVHFLDHPGDMPRRISDVVPGLAWRSHRVYSELFVPMQARHQLGIAVGIQPPKGGKGWAINRFTCDFTDREVEVAAALQPVLTLLDRVYSLAADPPGTPEQREESRLRSGLTVRELEMLSLAAEGYTARQIARLCRISPRTVDTHLYRVYQKLECRGRVLAVNEARRRGLL
jgi:DNA-binding CsgD family transcriptional regulator